MHSDGKSAARSSLCFLPPVICSVRKGNNLISMQKRIGFVKQIEWGDIDGLYDPHLLNYFVDLDFWNQIVREKTFYVIGRKGTGKSAIYQWLKAQEKNFPILVSNLSFKHFPFEKLLSLEDNNFSAPNQYQSIWRNIILSEFAKLIVHDQSNPVTDEYRELKKYVDYYFGNDLIDVHKKVTEQTSKTQTGLKKVISIFSENAEQKKIENDYGNVTIANAKLENIIIKYLLYSSSNTYIIQFDQLDDNYNQYTDKEAFFNCIISLFKVIYDLNQQLRLKEIPSKIVAYLRSDIFYQLHQRDAESARWDDFLFYLNWAIISRSDWQDPWLLKLLNKRITSSVDEVSSVSNPFYYLFDNSIIKLKDFGRYKNVFKYMVDRSFHRPRDLIQFSKKIQEQVKLKEKLTYEEIKGAERHYSLWLLSELENEIAYRFPDIELLYEFLRLLGKRHISFKNFKDKYKKYSSKIGMDEEELIHLLYDTGIVLNLDVRCRPYEFYSIIRNERSRFNRDLQIVLHRGVWSGLSAARFMKK